VPDSPEFVATRVVACCFFFSFPVRQWSSDLRFRFASAHCSSSSAQIPGARKTVDLFDAYLLFIWCLVSEVELGLVYLNIPQVLVGLGEP